MDLAIRINRTWLLLAFLCLLLACDATFALFKKPSWLRSSQVEQDFWSQMSKDFIINCDENNPYVQKQIRWYQRHPKHLQKILQNAQPIIYQVYELTRKHHLPAELALIPLIESQYNPASGARSGPAGLWQFMPGTAKKFGLTVNRHCDERRDVKASTKAALSYLSYLYKYFDGNWLLALAAYQSGEGSTQFSAHRRMNFWDLPLHRETRDYVPKLLAIATIIKQPQDYHFSLPVARHQNQSQDVAWQEANQINEEPSLPEPEKTNKTTSKKDKIQSHAKKLKKVSHAKTQKYKIRSGDTLESIAKKFAISVKQLKQSNPSTHDKKLKINRVLIIPSKSRE